MKSRGQKLQDLIKAREKKFSWFILKIFGSCVFGLILVDILFLWSIWPHWGSLRNGSLPESKLISEYRQKLSSSNQLPELRWKPVGLHRIPVFVQEIFIRAEDSRFYLHKGVDWLAVGDAISYNWKQSRVALGASTISQQTIKNLFLSLSRDPLRKWHELVLTHAMEKNLSKKRILEIYLNIIEFGEGIFGVEAASQRYFQKSASEIGIDEACQLAASLPSPKKHNPQTQTIEFLRREEKVRKVWNIYSSQKYPKSIESTNLFEKQEEFRKKWFPSDSNHSGDSKID